MFHSDQDYEDARRRYEREALELGFLELELRRLGIPEAAITRTLEARLAAQQRLLAELRIHEQRPRPEAAPGDAACRLGDSLIACRKALGLSPKDFAAALGVPEEQVVRDEATRYRNVSTRAARRILGTLESLYEPARAVAMLASTRRLKRPSASHGA